MKKIRFNCFETNSSSAHSLVILKENEYVSEYEKKEVLCNYGKNIVFNFYEVDFSGRGSGAKLSKLKEKLAYAFCSLGPTRFDEILSIVHEIFPNVTTIKIPVFWEEDSSYVNCKLEGNVFVVDRYEYVGEICGQSHDCLSDYLEKENLTLKEFLLNRKYIVYLCNDCIDTYVSSNENVEKVLKYFERVMPIYTRME